MTDDDDLRALMRRADPTNAHPPLDDARIRRVVAAAERDDLAPAPRKRARLLIAGASLGAVATAAGAALIAGLVATPALQAPGPTGGYVTCEVPTAAELRTNDTAYEALVTGVDDGVVTLEVSHVFTGTPDATVELPQSRTPSGDDLFVTGRTYLVASTGGFTDDCLTGPATAELRAVYEQAFGPGTGG
ncbi:hypothetical protein [Microbacterium sp. NPDC086615]|jgi:hypothetical protein|uniref:hypothetical protein n=1 Tax=Microbacterium sp. NPDC086615 TaxID=3154865 RepID=UPI00342FE8AD|nr:hypothetical protein [Microbacterium sp.]